jgi:PAS domain S-box-containing protein
MAGRDAMCTFFNKSWLEFSGRSMGEELGVGWTEGVHPEDFEHCMRTYMEAFNSRRPFEMEYRLRRYDGEYRWILDRGVPRTTPAGEFAGHIGSCIDITDRIEAENRTRAVADDLARANLYLERLLYATSHDLREPIRSVHNFTELLGRHLDGQLDETSRDYLERVLDGAVRMRGLVDGMLEFASLRNRATEPEEVDMADLLASAAADFSVMAAEVGLCLEIGPLPVVRGDRAQLDRAFRNLIVNAIKYRGEENPWIEVTAERSGDEWVFCVADNGIGFEQKEGDRIFEIFQRLHPRRLYPGFGIGLALVRDIVERHHGRAWVASVPSRGSRFYVALPAM